MKPQGTHAELPLEFSCSLQGMTRKYAASRHRTPSRRLSPVRQIMMFSIASESYDADLICFSANYRRICCVILKTQDDFCVSVANVPSRNLAQQQNHGVNNVPLRTYKGSMDSDRMFSSLRQRTISGTSAFRLSCLS